MFNADLGFSCIFLKVFLHTKEVRHITFGENLEGAEKNNKYIGINPQALISHLKPIVNHKNLKNIIIPA